MKKIFGTGLLAVAMLFTACDQQHGEVKDEPADFNKNTAEEAKEINRDNNSVKEECSDFLVEAASNNQATMELSRLAQEKAFSKEVRAFAQQVIQDHAQMESELQQIADQNSLTLPNGMVQGYTEKVESLGDKKGEDFDLAYLDAMVSIHKENVNIYDEAAEDCEENIKTYASGKLPMVQKHLDLSKMMNEAIKQQTKESYTEEPAKEGRIKLK